MRTLTRLLFSLVMLALAVAAGVWTWNYYMYTPWTRDGRVRAEVITIAPDVSGWIARLNVRDNEHVDQGEVMFAVDDARYRAALDEAKARAESARVTWEQSLHDYQRRQRLSSQSISREDLETSRLTAAANEASYHAEQAAVASAQLNLDRTLYRAPVSGHVVNLALRQGDYINQGSAQMSMIRDGSYYVTGYFEETKMPSIRIGDAADIWLMSGTQRLSGRVVSIGRGISNSNTTQGNELLPDVAPTFTWVRLAQRIPVDVVLDEVPEGTLLTAGMTATVRIRPPVEEEAQTPSPQAPDETAPSAG
ncbi:efflux RND transporter periplasmic adaptor subunit [Halotalea alkalilenta]|uniref:Efflux transporter periplasmic adaptor subunit n=1 Tax=Halotalea alkalilenta TaxID=376489 RepID=A0A172YI72_9GAMM|nr:HlyD family secretion protein [Halotalea alkalilenta]ANF58893.1 efflux transporter periplasmic adaptor subunit [Halotalea alkalilenta]